jgi:tetratricopeptide (TPR) repeat protein
MKRIFIISIVVLSFSFIIISDLGICQTAEDYYYKANVSLTSGKMSEAVGFYNQAVLANPDFFEAYIGLSIAYREIGNYDRAYDSIQKVFDLKPTYYQAYYNLGLILEKQGKFLEAINAYEKFLDQVPGASKFTDARLRITKLKNK